MHILRKTFFSKEQQKNFKFFLRRNIECTPLNVWFQPKGDVPTDGSKRSVGGV